MWKALYVRLNRSSPLLGSILQRIVIGKRFLRKRIKGKNNRFLASRAMLKNITVKIDGADNLIEIAEDARLNGVTFHIRGSGHRVRIGAGCRFNRGGTIWMDDQNCCLQIGPGTTFEDVHIAVLEPNSRVVIGDDCMFAYDIDIRTSDSHPIFAIGTGERINLARDIRIADHVWVAAHAVILKGVEIGYGAIVSTGAIVTRPVGPNTIAAGNPATVIKEGVTWGRDWTVTSPPDRPQDI
ncbi:MAG: acyltransferase [Anaerolineales bacterium]|nr:acyltransferase [Anaerolineales bacterium]